LTSNTFIQPCSWQFVQAETGFYRKGEQVVQTSSVLIAVSRHSFHPVFLKASVITMTNSANYSILDLIESSQQMR